MNPTPFNAAPIPTLPRDNNYRRDSFENHEDESDVVQTKFRKLNVATSQWVGGEQKQNEAGGCVFCIRMNRR